MKFKIIIFKGLTLLILSSVLLYKNYTDFKLPYICGDGFEYVLMTEAFINHGTPDITINDVESFKLKVIKSYGDWYQFPKFDYIDNLTEKLKNTPPQYLTRLSEYFANAQGKWYSYHFWAYSLINTPIYSVMSEIKPIHSFFITNSVLIIITCAFLIFYTPFHPLISILSAICFCFSAPFWYVNWSHPEVYTMTFLCIGLILYLNKNYLFGLFFISIACLQNQPLSIFLALLSLHALFKLPRTILNFIKIGLVSGVFLLAPLFYYFHFKTTNLIKDVGFLDYKYITMNRIFGFYFDFNLGIILAIPLILLTSIYLYFEQIRQCATLKKFSLLLLTPLALLIISITVSTMGNWNHGMSIINRYGTWVSIIIMIPVFYLISKKSYKISIITFILFSISQISTCIYHQQFNEYDYAGLYNRPLAKWFYRNAEKFYNPDPHIFAMRLRPFSNFDEFNSPYIFFYKRQPKKILVHRNKIDDLKTLGIDDNTLNIIKQKISYNYDWGYIDTEDFKTTLTNEELFKIINDRKINEAKEKIQKSIPWNNQIKEKAKQWGKTYEEVLQMDAEYILSLEEKENDKI